MCIDLIDVPEENFKTGYYRYVKKDLPAPYSKVVPGDKFMQFLPQKSLKMHPLAEGS